MKILIDTHIAVWAVSEPGRLSEKARNILLDEENEIYYSTVSVWELTIKHHLHPDTFLLSGRLLEQGCEESGFVCLPVFNRHALELETLSRPEDAPPHKDPFDRMLLSQAKAEGLYFMTHDALLTDYNEPFIISV